MSECRSLLDMIVVVDGSDSITADDFSTLKNAILSLLEELTLGEEHVRFGLVLYSSNITTVLDLSSDKKQLKTDIAALTHSRQGTNTHLGIHEMNLMFSKQGRHGVPKVGIVITDGISKQPKRTANQAAIAKANNINMYAVGITKFIDMTELKNIASSDENAILYERFDQVKTGIVSLMKHVCPTMTTTPMPTPTSRSPVDCITRSCGMIGFDEEMERVDIDNDTGIELDDDVIRSQQNPVPQETDSSAGGTSSEETERDDDVIRASQQNPVSQKTGCDDDNENISSEETERDDDSISSSLPSLKSESDETNKQTNKHGLWNTIFGRRRAYYDDDMGSYYRNRYGQRQKARIYFPHDD